MNNKLFGQGEIHQNYALRKLTIGVTSVLVGTLFMVQEGTVAHAADNEDTSSDAKVANVQTNDSAVDIQSSTVELGANKIQTTSTDDNTTEDQDNNVAVTSAEKQEETKTPTSAVAQVINSTTDNSSETNISDDQSLTREDVIDYLELNRPDISEADLAKIGLAKDEYYFDGVKYHVGSWAEATPHGNKADKPFIFNNLSPHHQVNGEIYWPNSDKIDDEQIYKNFDILYKVALIPIVHADGTFNVYVDQKLTPEDAKNSINTANKDQFRYEWDNSDPSKVVDTSKPGIQYGDVVLIYKSSMNLGPTNPDKPVDKYVHTNVTVDVLEPITQKTITLWQGDTAPSADSVVNNYVDLTKKIPGTSFSWNTRPDTKNPTDEKGKVYQVVTHWPDNTTTTRDVTVIVKQLIKNVTETTQATRDIYVQLDAKPAIKYDTQIVVMIRKGQLNLKTNQTTWGVWTPAQMMAYKAPEFNGYKVQNPDAAPAIDLDGVQTDYGRVVFIYTKTTQPTNPSNPTTPENPTTPVNPTNPVQPSTPAPTPHDQVTPSDNDDNVPPNVTDTNKGGNKTNNRDNGPVGSLENMNDSSDSDTTTVETTAPHAESENNSDEENQLPQTSSDSDKNETLGVIGAAIAAVGSFLGLANRKKRKQ